MARVKSLRSVLKDFAEWTSIPGPIQIVYALNTFTRLLWVGIWLALFGVFVYQFVLIVQRYLQFPAEVHDVLGFKNPKKFPVITLCNQNPYRMDLIRANANFSSLLRLVEAYKRVVQTRDTSRAPLANSSNMFNLFSRSTQQSSFSSISEDQFEFNNTLNSFQREQMSQTALRLLAAVLPESVRRQAVYRLHDIVLSCSFNGVLCSEEDFSEFLDPVYGICYRFHGTHSFTSQLNKHSLNTTLTKVSPKAATNLTTSSATKFPFVKENFSRPTKSPFAVLQELLRPPSLWTFPTIAWPIHSLLTTTQKPTPSTTAALFRQTKATHSWSHKHEKSDKSESDDDVPWALRSSIHKAAGPFGHRSNFRLRLVLSTLQFDPIHGQPVYLPMTQIAGIRIALNADLNEEPALDAKGLTFGPGQEWILSVENSKTRLLKAPFGRCVDRLKGGSDLYERAFRYTMPNCLRSCKQLQVIARCGCANPRYRKPANASYCSIENGIIHNQSFCQPRFECLVDAEARLYWTNHVTPLGNCSCSPTCHQETYSLSVSSHRFPAPHFTAIDHDFLPRRSKSAATFAPSSPSLSCASNSGLWLNPKNCMDWHRRNSLVVNFLYRGLERLDHEEKASYSLVKASNDLGGQMGLWLGVSVISIFELLALVFMVLLYFAQVPAVRVLPHPDEYDADPRFRQVQALRNELDWHEDLSKATQEQIVVRQKTREAKIAQMHKQLVFAQQVLSMARQRAQDASAEAAVSPQNVNSQAAAANAQALAKGAAFRVQRLHLALSKI